MDKRDLSGVIVPALAKTEVLSRVEAVAVVLRAAAASAATSRSRSASGASSPRRQASAMPIVGSGGAKRR